jgi:hypothetical protein
LTFQNSKSPLLLIALSGALASVSATALPLSNGAAATPTIPAALRPVLNQTLAANAGKAYSLDGSGCLRLPRSTLQGCFDAAGAHFSDAAASPVALRLAGYGRDAHWTQPSAVEPTIAGNAVDYAHHGITEWWRAMALGYEQGFTVTQKPRGSGALTVALTASRAATPKGDGMAWDRLHYDGLSVVDAAGKSLPATMHQAHGQILIAVDDSGTTYPVTIDPTMWVEQKVVASDGVAGDTFGFSASIDGSTALIGATEGASSPLGTDNGGAGAVYVFSNQAGSWTQSAKLTAADGVDNDQFGYFVALLGDTALIGAPNATIGDNAKQGAAYVFTRGDDGNWTQTQKLAGDDGAASDQFGWSVALDGGNLAIGARGATIGDNFAQGAVYVFGNSAGNWSQVGKLSADDGAEQDQLGVAVAIHGTSVLAGAPNAVIGSNSAQGAAYLFDGSSGSWTQTQKLSSAEGAANDSFGFALALDGVNALVAAPFATVGANPFQGAVYAYTSTAGSLTPAQMITADDGQLFDVFGIAVALDHDNAIITAPFFNASQGCAYLFNHSADAGWVQQTKFVASDAIAGEGAAFGYSAAISGDSFLIGQSLASTNFDPSALTYEGAAYFYTQPASDQIFVDGFDGP